MCDKDLLYNTKAILKYLIGTERGYQTVSTLQYNFYHFTGLDIPIYELGYNCLLTFLQNIPDTLTVIRFRSILSTGSKNKKTENYSVSGQSVTSSSTAN